MIILPTIYRPESLKRFIAAYTHTDASLPVYVVLDAGDAARYDSVAMPPQFKRVRAPAGTRIGDIFNMVFRQFPNEDYYGILSDDVVPETFRWDILLKEACGKDKIAWGYDGIQNELLPCHPFIGGDLVRKLGFLAAPGIKHWYVDNAWKDIAEGLNCGVFMPEIRLKHYHYTNGLAQKDRAYDTQPNPVKDEIAYNMWREKELPMLIKDITSSSK